MINLIEIFLKKKGDKEGRKGREGNKNPTKWTKYSKKAIQKRKYN